MALPGKSLLHSVRVVPAPEPEPLRVGALTPAQVAHVEMRYRMALGANDLSALAILAVEYFPALIATARDVTRGGDDET